MVTMDQLDMVMYGTDSIDHLRQQGRIQIQLNPVDYDELRTSISQRYASNPSALSTDEIIQRFYPCVTLPGIPKGLVCMVIQMPFDGKNPLE